MIIDTDEIDRYAVPAAVGAGGALLLSLVIPPGAVIASVAVAYAGFKAYRRYGLPDFGRIAGTITNRIKTKKETHE